VLGEVVGVGHHRVLDLDALLHLGLGRELAHRGRGYHAVLVAVDHQARGGTRGEEREVVEVGGRRHADEAVDLRPAHQELHGDPGAERDAGDPARGRIRLLQLQPVERGSRIRELARPVVEVALAAPHAAEVEAQHREPALHEQVVEVIDHLVVHGPAELRVRMQDERDGARGAGLVVVARFQTAGRPVDDQLRHAWQRSRLI